MLQMAQDSTAASLHLSVNLAAYAKVQPQQRDISVGRLLQPRQVAQY
jgi:hypothetical protein